jgi:methyl-accepting chemotaxis protein
VTQKNAANAEESASAAEELSSQAEELNGMVGELEKLVKGASSIHQAHAPAELDYHQAEHVEERHRQPESLRHRLRKAHKPQQHDYDDHEGEDAHAQHDRELSEF